MDHSTETERPASPDEVENATPADDGASDATGEPAGDGSGDAQGDDATGEPAGDQGGSED